MTTEPIQKELTVPLRPGEAFRLFTDDLAKWWPVDSHSVSAADGDLPASVTVEPFDGGQILEVKPDGTTAPWARVTRWEPGHAFGARWHVGRSEDEATDLLVVFTPTDTGTRVELTHGGFDALGDVATAVHGQYHTGWDMVLGQCFGTYCTTHSRTSVASG